MENKYKLYRSEREAGLTYREIAKKHSCSVQNIYNACCRVRKKILPSQCMYPELRSWLRFREMSLSDLLRILEGEFNAQRYHVLRNALTGKTHLKKPLIDKLIEITGIPYEKLFSTKEEDDPAGYCDYGKTKGE